METPQYLSGKKTVVVGTHGGTFHADEVFAIAVLKLLGIIFGFKVLIKRTRDQKVLERCDIRIDIGRTFNVEQGTFDHHQEGGTGGIRPNGVKYSSFGLIWKTFGHYLCKDAESTEIVDRTLVQPIDWRDTTQDVSAMNAGMPQGLEAYTISKLVKRMNPPFHKRGDADKLFRKAVGIAVHVLEAEIERAFESVEGKAYALHAVQKNGTAQLLILDRSCPWASAVARFGSNVLFVIYPSDEEGWMVQGKLKPGPPGQREPYIWFPSSWRGKDDQALQEVSGVSDAVFCHSLGHIARAMSLEGAQQLAHKAIALREQ